MTQIYYLKITATMPMFDATHRINPQPDSYEGALRYAKEMQERIGPLYSVQLIHTNEINEKAAAGPLEKGTLPV